MAKLLWVCLGSAVGGGARYLLSGWTLKLLGSGFPWGTLAVNLLGSFLLSAILVVGTETAAISPTLRLALTTGVMGGFTTYSTFNYETLTQLQEGALAAAAASVAATVFGCLAAGWAGWAAARWFVGL